MDPEALLAQLRGSPSDAVVDCAAKALSIAAESVSALADSDGYDTATLWWAAGTLSEACALLLPYRNVDLPDPPIYEGELGDPPEQLIDLLDAAADALARAARDIGEPDRIYAVARAGILAQQARDAVANAKVAA